MGTEQILAVTGGSILVQDFGAETEITGLTYAEDGYWWALGANPTGGWAGHANQLAKWTGREWSFLDITAPTFTGQMSVLQVTGSGTHLKEWWTYSALEAMWHPRGDSWSTTEHWTGRYHGPLHRLKAKSFDIPAFPNATTLNIAHGITGLDIQSDRLPLIDLRLMSGAGVASAAGAFGDTLKVSVTTTNIVLVSTVDLSTYTGQCRLEYCTNPE